MCASICIHQDVIPELEVENVLLRFPSLPDAPLAGATLPADEQPFFQPDFLDALEANEAPSKSAFVYSDNAELLRQYLDTNEPSQKLTIRNRLIENNQGLVISVAASIAGRRRELADTLISEGQMGLIAAIAQCNPTRISTFAGYARWVIRGAMLNYLRREREGLPDHAAKRLSQVRNAIRNLAAERGLDATDLAKTSEMLTNEEIASKAALFPGTVEKLRDFIGGRVELDSPGLDGTLNPIDRIGASDETPDAAVENNDLRVQNLANIEMALARLKPQHAQIIRLHFGLDGQTEHSPTNIAIRLGISRQRVAFVIKEGLKALREELGRLESLHRLAHIRRHGVSR